MASREMLIRWLLRDELAICRDWSSLDKVYCLHLDQGPLYAAYGYARWQPVMNDPAGRDVRDEVQLIDGVLAGGGFQYVIDLDAQNLSAKVRAYDSVAGLSAGGEA